MAKRKSLVRKSRERYRRWATGFTIYATLFALAGLRCIGPSIIDAGESLEFNIGDVSAQRAMADIRFLIGPENEIHVGGTEANRRVADRLVKRLQQLGLNPEQLNTTWNDIPLNNILVRYPGEKTTLPVIFVTHYDSCRVGPGAGDAMSCVGAYTETLRWMQANNVKSEFWFLFTDGEELGLLGATQFVTEQKDLFFRKPFVINMDARGNKGPAVMFQTNSDNLGIVRKFGNQLGQPAFTNSIMNDVYQRLPNGTDFTVFLEDNWIGMNFALVFGADYYHTPEDTPDNLSENSVQHFAQHTKNIVSTIEQFNDSDWRRIRNSESATYFDILGGFVVSYPQRWDVVLVIACVAGWLATVIRSRMKRGIQRIPLLWLIFGVFATLGASLFTGLVCSWGLQILEVIEGNSFVSGYLSISYMIVALTSFVVMAVGNIFFSRCSLPNARLALVSAYSLFTLFAFVAIPSATYLIAIPTVGLIIVCLIDFDSFWLDFASLSLWSVFWPPITVLFCGCLGPSAGVVLGIIVGLGLIPSLVLMTIEYSKRVTVLQQLLNAERIALNEQASSIPN